MRSEPYYKKFEYLAVELLDFFNVKNMPNLQTYRTVMEFLSYYQSKYRTKEMPQPIQVSKMCDILVENNILRLVRREGFDNMDNSYVYMSENDINAYQRDRVNEVLNNLVYGFPYIYESMREYVVPIKHITKHRDETIGTGFVFNGGIVTARHCIEGAVELSIRDVSCEALKSANFIVHKNPLIDVMFIKLNEPLIGGFSSYSNAEILDEVITLGYPLIAGFHNFLTVEKANVASRLTTSKGQVVAFGEDIWVKEKLLLITAKIKGGNSGGPVINKKGEIIGITSQKAFGEGNYDDLGYGTIMPIDFLLNAIENKEEFNVEGIEFMEF